MSNLIYVGVCDASTLPHPELHNPWFEVKKGAYFLQSECRVSAVLLL